MQNNSASCAQNNSATQSFSLTDIKLNNLSLDVSDISQELIQAPNFSCISANKSDADLANQFKTEFAAQSQAATSGFGGVNSMTDSTIASKITNDISNHVSISNTSSCVQQSLASQDLKMGGYVINGPGWCTNGCPKGNVCDLSDCKVNIHNIKQKMTQSAVAQCLGNNSALTAAINDAATSVKATTSSTTTGVDPATILKSLFSGPMAIIGGIILAVLILVGGVAYMFLSGGGDVSALPFKSPSFTPPSFSGFDQFT